MSRLILIRHGQASFLSDNYDQLSDKGKRQSRILGDFLTQKEPKVDAVYVGPLQRHKQTWQEVELAFETADVELPTPIHMPELGEHMGTQAMHHAIPHLVQHDPYIAKSVQQAEEDPTAKRKIYFNLFTYFCRKWSEGAFAELTGHIQSWQAFRDTVNRGLQQIQEENQGGKTVLAFTSGGTTAASMGYTLGLSNPGAMELNFIVQNTALTEMLFSNGSMSLMRFNHIPHLSKKELITFV